MASGIVIASLITGNAVLTSLNLYLNSIGNEGAIAIANALKSGRSVLNSLDLSFNSLDAEAGKALAASLAVNAVLTTIECVPRAQKRDPRLKICTHMFSILARTCQYPGSHLIGSYTRDLGVCAGIAALFGSDPSRHTPDVRSRRTLQTHTLQAQTHQT